MQVKPGMPYLDIIKLLKDNTRVQDIESRQMAMRSTAPLSLMSSADPLCSRC